MAPVRSWVKAQETKDFDTDKQNPRPMAKNTSFTIPEIPKGETVAKITHHASVLKDCTEAHISESVH